MANEFIARNGLIAQNNSTVTGSLIVTAGITGSFTGSFVGDGSGLTGITVPSGVFGITNSSGSYTYYTTLSASLSAATSGQTIEMFADYTETSTTATLKNGVNINGNSHTYTLNKTGTDSALIDNGVAVDCSIDNIKIVRTGGTASTVSNACILLSGASNIKTDAIFSSVVGVAIILNNANCYLNGGKSFTTGYSSIYVLAGNLLNHYNELNTNDYYYGINNSGTIINCHSTFKGANYHTLISSGGVAMNCSATALTSGGYAASFNNSGIALNCTGKSISVAGFGNSGKAENCSGYSSSSTGFSNSGVILNCSGYSISGVGLGGYNGQYFGCIGYSTGNYGISVSNGNDGQVHITNCSGISTAASAGYFSYSPNNGGIKNCTFKSLYNSSAGHGIELTSFNNSVNGCNIYVTGAGANCIYKAAAGTIKYASNIFEGATTPVNANITQGITNTHDNQGNILM